MTGTPTSRPRIRLPRPGRRRRLLAVALALAALVVGAGAYLWATAVRLVPVANVAPAGRVIGPKGDWPEAPVNSQYGTVRVHYRCSLRAAGVLPLLSTDLSVEMTGIFPLTAAAGQPFYVTDGKGQATLPAATVNRLRGFGVRQVQGRATRIDIYAFNAVPDVRNATGGTRPALGPTRLVADRPLTMPTPATGAFRIGPFVSTGTSVQIGIGALRAELTAVFAGGVKLPVTVEMACDAPDPVNLVALVTIGGAPSSTPVDISGTLQPATLPEDSGLLGAVIPYPCAVSGYGRFAFPTNVNAFVTQLYVRSGQRFSFLYGHGYVTIPSVLTDALLARNPTAATASITLTRLGTIADNATPADQNYLRRPVTGDPLPLARNRSVVIHFPPNGTTLPPEDFVAGAPGILRIYLGNSAGTITLRDKAGRPVGPAMTLTCDTMQPLIPLLPYVVAPADPE